MPNVSGMKSIAAACLLVLAGCADTAPIATTSDGAQLRMEQYCVVEGVPSSLRQTFVIVDAAALTPIEDAAQFSAVNGWLRDAVMAFADPVPATDSGRSAHRERITLLVAPTDGAAPKQAFTGCLPTFSSAERAAIAGGESQLSSFFTGGFQQRLDDDIGQFRALLAGALIQAARSAGSLDDGPSSSRLFASLGALGQVFRSTEMVPRIVLLTNTLPRADDTDVQAIRARGHADGLQADIDLGNADVMLIAEGSGDAHSRHYLSSYLLAMNGHLSGWASEPAGLSPQVAPTRVTRYSGTAAYPDGNDHLIQIRLATDQGGKLVNSWLTLMGLNERAIPMTGQAVCTQLGCQMRSDQGGFAQAWVAARGSEPVFDNEAPFAGMREWSLSTDGDDLSGEVFDSAVSQVGPVAGQRGIAIRATLQPKADF